MNPPPPRLLVVDRRRPTAWTLGPLLAVLVLVATADASPATGATACDGRTRAGEWTVITAPDFAAGPPTLLDHDVAWADEDLVLATNGQTVMGSRDGGCTWGERWRSDLAAVTDAAGEGSDQGRVVDVVASPDGDPDRITLLLHDASTAAGSSARILVTRDGGATWTSPTVPPAPVADSSFGGACPPQAACRLERAPGDPDALLLTSAPGPVAPGALWRSEDGGDTWEVVATSLGSGDPFDSTFRGIAPAVMSPSDSSLVHATVGCRDLRRSEDGGRTWAPVDVPLSESGFPVGIAVAHPARTAPTLAVVQHAGYCVGTTVDAVHLSTDGGASWTTEALVAEDLDGVALDRSGRVGAVTDESGAAWLIGPGRRPSALTAPGGRTLRAPGATGTRDGVLTFAADDAVLVLSTPTEAMAAAVPRTIPEIGDLGTCDEADDVPAPLGPASLRARSGLTLPSGGSGRVETVLTVPPRAVPVDVFGVLDASGSMSEAIDSLSRTVVEAGSALAAERIDLHLGFAEFRSRNTVAYRRLLPVGPIDCRAGRALATIEPDGNDETHLIALHQALTGAGLAALGVPSGRAAGFRDDALRIVLHATDEPITEGQPHDPELTEVVDAFGAARAEHVGVLVRSDVPVDTGSAELDPTRASLDRLGRSVGTVAPAAGIDCNGDGLRDIAAGDPVTCPFGTATDLLDDAGLGGVLVQVVRGLVEPVAADLVVADPGAVEVVVTSAPTSFDRREGATTVGSIHVRCPAEPLETTVTLHGRVDEVVVSTAAVSIRCGATPEAPAGATVAPPAPARPSPPAPSTATASPPLSPGAPPAPVPGAPPAASSVGPPTSSSAAASSGASASSSASANASATSVATTPTVVGLLADDPEAATATSFAASRTTPNPAVPIGAAGLLAATAWGLHGQTRTRHQERRP